MHPNILQAEQSALVVIDVQEAFRGKIADFEETAKRIAIMVQASKLIGLPIIVTEQYPKGLGHTAAEIAATLDNIEVIEKTTFSSCGVPAFQARLANTGARQVLICGLEAHICVNQTVHDLLAAGLQVHLITDCITSRDPRNKVLALARMQACGAIPSSVEMALFELMRDARHQGFRDIQKLIK